MSDIYSKGKRTSPAEEYMLRSTEICGRCLFRKIGIKNVITLQIVIE